MSFYYGQCRKYKSKMKQVLISLAVFFVFFSCSQATAGYISQVYIDPSASASGDGRIESPYKFWSEVVFKPDTAYFQKKGTVAREQIIINASGTESLPLLIGSYGTGNQPVILGSEKETGWVSCNIPQKRIFKKKVTLKSGEGLGLVLYDGVPMKFLPWTNDVAKTFKDASSGFFSCDHRNATIYIWCPENKNPASAAIEVSRRYFGIRGAGVNNITIKDIEVKWASMHGISFEDSSGCIIDACTVRESGGTALAGTFVGNGIEFGNSSKKCMVRNCTATDIFDSGFTVQTYNTNKSASDIIFENVKAEKCGFAGIEIAVLSVAGANSSNVKNILMRSAQVIGSGTGWSQSRNGQGTGIKINADPGYGNSVSGVIVDKSSVTSCSGKGIWAYGETGKIQIFNSKIFDNTQEGILIQDLNSVSTGLILGDSQILSNGINRGDKDKCGVVYHAPKGAGAEITGNKFNDNGFIGLMIPDPPSGQIKIKKNIFDSSSVKTHFYSGGSLEGADIGMNEYREHGGDIIGFNGKGYKKVNDFSLDTHHDKNGKGF